MKRVSLYTPCTYCGGHGRVAERPGTLRRTLCPSCGGKGFLPTQEGETIVGLLRAVKLEDLLPEG